MSSQSHAKHLGLLGATGVGVGAIVGGGVLALAGVAFAVTGPGAILAFALNGAVALLTAFSFAELSSRFPVSGGTYAFARKILTVDAAFAIGWVVWFASVVAAVLYAMGFAVFFLPFLEQLVSATGGQPPAWLGGRFALLLYALGAVAFYVWGLTRSSGGGGQWATVGKVAVFAVILAGGFWVLLVDPPESAELAARFRPFLSAGGAGLVQAMGYTFIALQGFDLIAAVGGEVRSPERNIPRAMFLSLGAALVIYLPLLFLVVAVGTPGQSVVDAARQDPEILIAIAAGNFMGPVGYWLVVVAGVLSMLSALQANLLAASRVARAMAVDRTLPLRFAALDTTRRTPVPAIQLTGATVAFLVVALPDVAAAGAMSGLIFLVSFATAHGISYLARSRAEDPSPFRSPFFPLVPLVGGILCLALGLFQAVAVPAAGALAALWISAGAVLYVTSIGRRARVVDASSEALDPELLRLRGRSPRILVPIANPANAPMLVSVAHALAPQGVARALLLSVVREPERWPEEGLPRELSDIQAVLGGALSRALGAGLRPEVLVTVSHDPWGEIERVAERYRCDRLLLGVGELGQSVMTGPLERLMSRVSGDVVILRAPGAWKPDEARRILVPSGGGRFQSSIRARLLGSLIRTGGREITYLRALPPDAHPKNVRRTQAALEHLAADESPGHSHVEVVRVPSLAGELVRRASDTDLIVLGLPRALGGRKIFGPTVLEIVKETSCPLLMISQQV